MENVAVVAVDEFGDARHHTLAVRAGGQQDSRLLLVSFAGHGLRISLAGPRGVQWRCAAPPETVQCGHLYGRRAGPCGERGRDRALRSRARPENAPSSSPEWK